jgi:hypothetical protein
MFEVAVELLLNVLEEEVDVLWRFCKYLDPIVEPEKWLEFCVCWRTFLSGVLR